jgi:hypothetical protein
MMDDDPLTLAHRLIDAHDLVADLVPGQDALVIVRQSTLQQIVAHLFRLAALESSEVA